MGESRNVLQTSEEPLTHGGAIDAMRARYSDVREPWIDLSTGINSFAYPIARVERDVWARLPQDSDEAALRGAAARRYGAHGVANVVSAPGTQAIIQILPQLFERGRVAVVGPTYAEHAAAWRRGGHDVVGAADLEHAIAARPDVLVVVNPNNPTGRVYAGARLRDAANDLASSGGVVVVDEAFVDLCDERISLVPLLPDNAIVLRSFGKTYGLAGVRLGFAIAAHDFAARLRAQIGQWAVSGPALEIGRRALQDDTWLSQIRLQLARQCSDLEALLVRSGFTIVGKTALFVLGSIDDAEGVRERLARNGIHVRHFPEQPTWLRFGIPGDRTALERVEAAFGA